MKRIKAFSTRISSGFRRLIVRAKLAYYVRALSDMGIAHPDFSAVLMRVCELHDQLDGSRA